MFSRIFTLALLLVASLTAAKGNFTHKCDNLFFNGTNGPNYGNNLIADCDTGVGMQAVVHNVLNLDLCIGINKTANMIFQDK